jgi:hypothetical protein
VPPVIRLILRCSTDCKSSRGNHQCRKKLVNAGEQEIVNHGQQMSMPTSEKGLQKGDQVGSLAGEIGRLVSAFG